MQHRRRCALTAAAALLALCAPAAARPETATPEGTHVWRVADPDFGGFSGIEMSKDGTRFQAVTDRAHLFWGEILRGPDGRIRDMRVEGQANLRDSDDAPLPAGRRGDSEGIAVARNGSLWISFEGHHRIARYTDPNARPARVFWPPDLPGMSPNAGYEALAIDPRDRPVIIPERSASRSTPFTALALDRGEWVPAGQIPRDGRWLPVGADFGPDGRLYLLERDFLGPLGFASRVRSMELGPDGTSDIRVLIQSRPMQYDNLEGISVWFDGDRIRITMISDDNFLFLQRTEVVKYTLAPDGRHASGG